MKISLLILFMKIILILQKKIFELNNESFNNLLESNKYDKNKKLLVIFYTKNCKACKEAINILSKDIIEKYKYDNSIDFGKVDCDSRENIWLNLRFNISRIPKIILIVNGNFFYELNSNYDKYEISHFINDLKNKKESLEIPNDIDINKKRVIVLKYTINYISQFFKYHFNININKNLIIFILILLLLLFLYIIIYLLEYCCYKIFICGKCRKKSKKIEKKKIAQVHMSEDLSGISSDISGSKLEYKEEDSEITNNGFFDEEMDEFKAKKLYKEKTE